MSNAVMGALADIAHIEMGQSPAGSSTNKLGIGDPLLNGPSEFGDVQPTPQQWTVQGVRFAEPGDTLFCVRGSTTGRMNVADQRFAIGRGLAAIRGKRSDADTRFAKYALENVLPELLAGVTGSVFPNLSRSQIGSQKVALPPAPTRKAIVEVLGALDDKIAANTKLAMTADEYLGAQFRREMGDGFESGDLGTIAEVNAESVKPVDGGQLRYIDIASVGVGAYAYPDLASWEDAPGRARRRVRVGDTLWSTVRPNRRSHSLNLSDDPRLVASTGLAVLSPREVGFAYLYEATRLAEFATYLENVAEGSAYPAVRAEFFKSAPVPLISPDRRAAFEALAAPMRKHLHCLSEENRALSEMRDILLPQLMSGDLCVRTSTKGA